MKKIIVLSVFCGLVLTFSSCRSSSKVPQALKAEQENPYGKQVFQTKSEQLYIAAPGKRAYGKGISFDESTARELAEMDARAQFSRALDAAIVSASKKIGFDISKYAGGNGEGMSVTDGGLQQNSLVKSISSNIISGTNIINVDKYYGKDRKYTVFVCLEYNGSVAEIAKKVTEQIKQMVSDQDRQKIQFQNDKYEKEVKNDLESSKRN